MKPAKTAKKTSASPKVAAKTVGAPAAKPAKKAAAAKAARKRPQVPATLPAAPMQVTEVEIATRAYFIYVNEGRPSGCEMRHWLEAETQLRSS